MIRLGRGKSRVASAIVVEKRVYNEASAWKTEGMKDRVYLGCNVIKEKTLACALESTKRISSPPWTKQVCTMVNPVL
jgi:hypothetical protein